MRRTIMVTSIEYQPYKEEEQERATNIAVFFIISAIVFFIWGRTRRISRIENLPDNYAGMILYGVVTGIPDGDGFKFFHCPWLRDRSYTSKDGKLYVRLAGIDAPEMGRSNMPGQPFAHESKVYLRSLIQGENIKIKIVGVDQYDRILAVAYRPRWFLKPFFNRWLPIGFFEWFLNFIGWFLINIFGWFKINFFGWLPENIFYINVNLEMAKHGFACVYKGRDAIYDEYKETLTCLEEKAKREKKGMWVDPYIRTPMEHRRIYRYGKS